MITQSPRFFACHQTLTSMELAVYLKKTVFSYVSLPCVYKFHIVEFLKFKGLLGCLTTEGLVARQNLKHLLQFNLKQRGDIQRGPSMSVADNERSDATIEGETPEVQQQQPIVEMRNQVDDDNYGDDSEVLEVCHDQRPVPEVLQQVNDEGRQPNSCQTNHITTEMQ